MKNLQAWQRTLIIWGTVVLIVACLYLARVVLLPVVLAILLTFILAPLVSQLQRIGLGRITSSLLVVAAACLLVGAIGLVVLLQLQSLALELPTHKEVIIEKLKGLHDLSKDSWYDEVYAAFTEIAEQFQRLRGEQKEGTAPLQVMQSTDYWALMLATLGPALDFLVNVGIVIIFVIFMLINREDMRNRLLRLWGTRSLTSSTRALDDASSRISRFLQMQLVVNGTYGIAAGLGLFLIGVPYALLWGFLTAMLRYIPYLGPWLGALLPLALSIAVFPSWLPLVLVVALFVVLELISNNVMEPWLYGRSIGVSEIAILLAAVFWAWLWGPLGLLLSTPLTACLVVLGHYLPTLAFLDVLLGDKPVLEKHVTYFQRLLARDEDEASELIEQYLESQSLEVVCDQVLLPALHLAKVNQERDDVTDADMLFIARATQQILDEVAPPPQPLTQEGESNGLSGRVTQAPPPLVFGCPVRDEADELALRMFSHLLDPVKCRFEVLSHRVLSGELRSRIAEEQPAAVCLFVMPPGGLSQARMLCKRLRSEFPELKILVAYWQPDEQSIPRLQEQLTRAGATEIASNLAELRDKLAPLLPVFSSQEKQKQRDATTQAARAAH